MKRIACCFALALALALVSCDGGVTTMSSDGGEQPPDLLIPYPPPLAPPSDPEPVPLGELYTTQVVSASDQVLPALEAGKLDVTGEGSFGDADWYLTTPAEDGSVPAGGPGITVYGFLRVDVPAGKYVFARPDLWSTLYANGGAQPGDVYGSGAMRVPLLVNAGKKNAIVFRSASPRGDPKLDLRMTSDEVYFNTSDLTTFDPVAGDSSEQWLGVPVLNLTDEAPSDFDAIVEDNADVMGSTVRYPSLPPDAVTKVGFRVLPKRPWPAAGGKITVAVRVLARGFHYQYRREITLTTVDPGKTFKRTFRSGMDYSAQYMGVVPPSKFDAAKTDYSLVLTLHGAGVEGIGQAQSYAPKDYAYVVAATNRRPFGFDWEEWGRSDAIEVLEEAQRVFKTAPDKVYLTGHSMGGHGTWNVGVLFPGRFALIGPSAGWASFYSYAGQPRPTGAFARSQASSDTYAWLKNLARRGVYAIHGTKDTNVPIREERDLVAALKNYTMDVQVHEEPGAGHWWSGPVTLGGAAYVDWPDLFADMQAHRLDPYELEFDFTTPLPSVNAQHSFVTVRSQSDFGKDAQVISKRTMTGVALTTSNVRGMVLDGKALRARGVLEVSVDGAPEMDVPDGPLTVGPQDGKRPGAYGPFNDALRRPFCFVWDEAGPPGYRRYAGYLTSAWAIIGNGQACAVPLSRVDDSLRAAYQLIYLGIRPAAFDALAWPMTWDKGAIVIDHQRYDGALLVTVLPEGERLNGVITTAAGNESVLYRYQPFHSGFAAPDWMVFGPGGAKASGFVRADWKWNP